MTTKQIELKKIVDNTINKFNIFENYLLDKDLSERCICSKFAMYLERELLNTNYSDYVVDVEYNRGMIDDIYDVKRLCNKNIIVDLIVHKRGYDYNHDSLNNLICIEMKKRGGKCNLTKDKNRLKDLTSHYYGFDYCIGFMLIVRKNGIVIDEVFYNK